MGKILLTGATLIDGTGAPPRKDAAVLVEDERIAAVGRSSDFEAGDAEVRDLAGATLLPGLINAHEHYSVKGFSGQYYDQHRQDARLQLLRAAQMAMGAADEGITTARDCGAFGTINLVLRQGIELGLGRGPRIVSCGQVIQPKFEAEGVKVTGMGRMATDATDVARVARELLAEGGDFIKMKVWWNSFTGKGRRNFTVEEIKAAVDVAHAAGKRAACHAWEPFEIRDSLAAGADSIEHALYAHSDLSVADEMARRRAILVPCHASWARSWSKNMPDRQPQSTPEQRGPNHRRFIEAAIRAGVRIATGTDLYAQKLVDEISALAEMGLGPHGAIQAATSVGAELADRASDLGTIEKSKRADLIAVEGDPLADLQVLRRPTLVMRDGRVERALEREAIPA